LLTVSEARLANSLPQIDFVIEAKGCHLDFATSGFSSFHGAMSDLSSQWAKQTSVKLNQVRVADTQGAARSHGAVKIWRRLRVGQPDVVFALLF